jgi:hypothetical protein
MFIRTDHVAIIAEFDLIIRTRPEGRDRGDASALMGCEFIARLPEQFDGAQTGRDEKSIGRCRS